MERNRGRKEERQECVISKTEGDIKIIIRVVRTCIFFMSVGVIRVTRRFAVTCGDHSVHNDHNVLTQCKDFKRLTEKMYVSTNTFATVPLLPVAL